MHLYDEMVRKMLNENPKVETKEILNQIMAMGYNGYENISRIRGKRSKEYLPQLPSVFWMPSKTSSLFYTDRQKLSSKEKELIDSLCQDSEEIKKAATLIQDFKGMMRTKNGSLLGEWIERASSSNIKEIKGFARGLLTDLDAVRNGINLPWSNGPVEGQVNKFKVIKRQMYGRASFELLRKRLVNHQT
jgi:transposase